MNKRFSSFWREAQLIDDLPQNSPEVRLLRELKARLEAPVPLEPDTKIKYENARQLLGQRLTMKLDHNVDINDYLNGLPWE